MLFTCAHFLEVLIVSSLSCRHNPGALIFKRSPGRCRIRHALLQQTLSILTIHNNGFMCTSEPFCILKQCTKMSKTPTQSGSCVSAMCQCHYHNVILSEFRTKEITYAPLGQITVQCAAAK